ncbi:hypothetical protein HMPREF9436_02397 [Faecalibacterium cf. prausnitzii KLE1255]|uniref:Uncharacterized protein n=1 Tax=Faecalibacterium cf. prausnitzii KLE1255 TaxID=748224 RepID=E2ZL43_9FIRM|nr:hypothetical protein HMPREF9436_02397 [Faecalibacterium cf. prausnitzii KLE1255]
MPMRLQRIFLFLFHLVYRMLFPLARGFLDKFIGFPLLYFLQIRVYCS